MSTAVRLTRLKLKAAAGGCKGALRVSSLLLLVNRHSRRGEADIEAIEARLREHGFALRRIEPESPAEAVVQLRRHCAWADVVAVGGGDGTLSQLAAALHHCGRPVGILPLGTANDLAASLGIPTDPLAAVDIIAAGHRQPVDFGEANGVPFFNAANVGLGTWVNRELSTGEKRRWGVFGYVRALARAWRRNRPFRADIECDGGRRRAELIQLVVGSGRRHGGGITIHEEADPSDGLLHLYALAPQRLWQLLRRAPGLRRGGATDGVALRAAARVVRVSTVPPLPVAADGEIVTRTPVEFHVVRGAIEVFVPERREG